MDSVQPRSGRVNLPSSVNRSGRVRAGTVPAEVRKGLDAVHPRRVRLVCREHGTSPGVVRSVLAMLGEHVDWKHGDAFPSVRRLAGRTGWHPRTVLRGLRALIAMGFVERRRGERAWRSYVPKLGATADRRRSAYRLTEWADRMGLPDRPAMPAQELTEYKLRSAREREREDREHIARSNASVVRSVAEQHGLSLDSIYRVPRAGGELARRARTMVAATPPRVIQPDDSTPPPTPTNVGKFGSGQAAPSQRNPFAGRLERAATQTKDDRGGDPPRIPPLRR